MTETTCRHCAWWAGTLHELRENKRGACQREAPQVVMVPDRSAPGQLRSLTVRPMVLPDETCRHWRERHPAPEPEPEDTP